MTLVRVLLQLAAVAFLPLLLVGAIQRTKARAAGRRGPPLLQPWRDVVKLLRKGSVRSTTTTWVFAAGPLVSAVTVVLAALLVPFGGPVAPVAFAGDVVAYTALFALGRFFSIAAAFDTGSAFGGMGGTRAASFALLAEPALLLALLGLVVLRGDLSLSGLAGPGDAELWRTAAAPTALACVALFIVLLAENDRIPFDDPTTHLELTMVHEAQLLDHGGPLLGVAQLAAAQKLFVQAALLVRIALPLPEAPEPLRWAVFLLGVCALGGLIGVIESTMARLRLRQLPILLTSASLVAAFGIVLGVA